MVRIGSHQNNLSHPCTGVELCPAKAPGWPLLFQSRVNLCARNRSKKTPKNEIRLTLVTNLWFLVAASLDLCVFSLRFDDLGIMIHCLQSQSIFELQTASWTAIFTTTNHRVIESRGWSVEYWASEIWSIPFLLAKWLDMFFHVLWTKLIFWIYPHNFRMWSA